LVDHDFEKEIIKKKILNNQKIPTVLFVLQGDLETLYSIEEYIKENIPVVIVAV
jgi:hypothetical protein